jgi:hypothetical protein
LAASKAKLHDAHSDHAVDLIEEPIPVRVLPVTQIILDKLWLRAEYGGTTMLTQVNPCRDSWHILAPMEIPNRTLTSARLGVIKAAGAIDPAL